MDDSSLTYQGAIRQSMNSLAADPARVFLGYSVAYSNQANGTLVDVPKWQLIETPVAENLIAGLATGLAMAGFKPVVWIERCDFVLNALDAIVNHLDKLPVISEGQYQPKVILRINVGNTKAPLFSGPTHTQDFSGAIASMVTFPVVRVFTPTEVTHAYEMADASSRSFMVIEYRDCYNRQ